MSQRVGEPLTKIQEIFRKAFWILSGLAFVGGIGIGGTLAILSSPVDAAFVMPAQTWLLATWAVLAIGAGHQGSMGGARSPLSRLRVALPAGLAVVLCLAGIGILAKPRRNLSQETMQQAQRAFADQKYRDALGLLDIAEHDASRLNADDEFDLAVGRCDAAAAAKDRGIAVAACRKAIALLPQVTPESLRFWVYLAASQRSSGDAKAALSTLEEAVGRGVVSIGAPGAKVSWNVEKGNAFLEMGRSKDAMEFFKFACAAADSDSAISAATKLDAQTGAAAAEVGLGLNAAALARLRPIQTAVEKVYAQDKPALATYWNNRGTAEAFVGQLAESRASCERAVQLSSEAFGADSVDAALKKANLGGVLYHLGDFASAAAVLGTALTTLQASRQRPTRAVCAAGTNAILAFDAVEQSTMAEERCKFVLEACREAIGEGAPEYGQALVACGLVKAAIGKAPEGRSMADAGLDIIRRALGGDHPQAKTYAGIVTSRFAAE